MNRLFLAVSLLPALGGCASATEQAQLMSAGYTGCMPTENRISNLEVKPHEMAWSATCQSQRYLCTSVKTGKDASSTHCAPAAAK
jgi:hypothetical protein